MANLSINVALVSPGTNATKETGTALVALTAGQVVYKDPATRKFGIADSNSATLAVRTVHGIALNSAGINGSVGVQRAGRINIGAIDVVKGESYYLSDTPGAICIETDLGAGEYPTFLGFGLSTTTIDLAIKAAGVVI